jgi:methyltransferase
MTVLWGVLASVAALRLGELALARHNTRRLLARGAREVAPRHYPLLVALHAGWLAAMVVIIPPDRKPDPWLLGLFGLLLVARGWVITSLGPYWTTRIITLPEAPLVRRGPYRLLRHPNYLVVVGEIAVLPLAFGAWRLALVFSLLNGLALAWRIRCENGSLAPRRRL